jgi:hypothetical protein
MAARCAIPAALLLLHLLLLLALPVSSVELTQAQSHARWQPAG